MTMRASQRALLIGLLFLTFVAHLPTLSSALGFKLHGINYSLRIGADWYAFADRCKDYDQVVADLTQLKAITNNVRVFSLNDCNSGDIMLRAVQEVGDLGLWLGMWVGPNGTNFVQERNVLSSLLQNQPQNFANVEGLHVSSEAIYRGDLNVTQAIDLRNTIKGDMTANGWPEIPVVVADIIDNYIQYPQLVTIDNVVHFNQFPFWERTTNINNAALYMQQRINLLQNVGTRPIVIGETGWADAGVNPSANPANAPSMRKWLRDFVCLAQANGWQYYWFIAYDSDWQRVNEQDPNGVEGHFGIYDENGVMKPFFQGFSIDCTQPTVNINPNAVTFAPTPTPGTLSPTDAPTSRPTSSPTRRPTNPPTAAPVVTVSTDDPTVAPVVTTNEPTVAPVVATNEPTSAPVVDVTSTPTASPSTASPTESTERPTDAPTDAPTSAQCSDHSACNALGLTGACCPTVDNWTLACCNQGSTSSTDSASNDDPPADQCDDHPQCAALGLANACCPTVDDTYLDCCEVVPNDCFEEGTCNVFSAVAYLEQQSAAGKPLSCCWGTPLSVLLLVVYGFMA